MDEADVTEVVRRHQHSGMNKTLAVLLGLVGVIAPCVTGYFALRQARVEAADKARDVRVTADIGYQTSTEAITLLQAAVREHDAEIAWLKLVCREQTERVSLPEPAPPPPAPTLVPLQRAKLFRALPQTLDMAERAAK